MAAFESFKQLFPAASRQISLPPPNSAPTDSASRFPNFDDRHQTPLWALHDTFNSIPSFEPVGNCRNQWRTGWIFVRWKPVGHQSFWGVRFSFWNKIMIKTHELRLFDLSDFNKTIMGSVSWRYPLSQALYYFTCKCELRMFRQLLSNPKSVLVCTIVSLFCTCFMKSSSHSDYSFLGMPFGWEFFCRPS